MAESGKSLAGGGPHFLILAGLPGMGKTCLRNRIVEENPDIGYVVASSDDYIERLAAETGRTYDELWPDHIKPASRACSQAMHEAVESGRSVIVDQMHGGEKARRSRVERARSAKYGARCIAFRLPDREREPDGEINHAVWRRRLAERTDKTLPEEKIQQMVEDYTMPTLDEGFDTVAEVDIFGQILYIGARAVP